MADPTDPSYWSSIGLAVGGIVAGIAAAFGYQRRGEKKPEPCGDSIESAQLYALRDQVRDMLKDIDHMQKAHAEDAAALKELETKHDAVMSGIFKEIKQMSNTMTAIQTEVRLALGGTNR